jgi:hypothetical protein
MIDHKQPPRTARTKKMKLLAPSYTLPLLKFTFQALFGAFFVLPPCRGGLRWGDRPGNSEVYDGVACQLVIVFSVLELFPLLEGLVLEVDSRRLLIEFGARRGAYEGMELEVFREREEVKHAVTGQPLRRREVRLATVGVVDVKEEFSEAVVVSREKEAKLSGGDGIRAGGGRITVALPFIDTGDVRSANVRSMTKHLAVALMKTGRFMVVEEHLIRASLASGRDPSGKACIRSRQAYRSSRRSSGPRL